MEQPATWLLSHPWRSRSSALGLRPLPRAMGVSWQSLLSDQRIDDLDALVQSCLLEAANLPDAIAVPLWTALALHCPPGGRLLSICQGQLAVRQDDHALIIAAVLGINPDRPGAARLGDAVDTGLLHRDRLTIMACRGQLAPVLRDADLMASLSLEQDRWSLLRYYDAVECGRIDEAMSLASGGLIDRHPGDQLARAYTAIAWLVQAMTSRHIPLHQQDIESPSSPWRLVGSPSLQQQVREVYASALGRPGNAGHAAPDRSAALEIGHVAAARTRSALLAGQVAAAQAMLEHRALSCASTTSDTVLRLRCAHRLGRQLEARELSRTMLADADRWSARGRLEFELRCATELGAIDLLSLALPDQPVRRIDAGSPSQPAHALIGSSAQMQAIRGRIARLATSELPLLITGPSGCGKELIAATAHQSSRRSGGPFVAVNCAALTDSLLESELFGHARGAFSGASGARPGLISIASDGTLFLDEIGDVTPHFQTVLLRLLENGEYRPVGSDTLRRSNCRIIAATNVDLEAAAALGRFRNDLLHRLDRLRIDIPPLADRKTDIPELALHFVAQARGGEESELSDDLLDELLTHAWPGNARELRNRMEEMVALAPGQRVYTRRDYLATVRSPATAPSKRAIPANGAPGETQALPTSRTAELEALFRARGRLTRRVIVSELGIAPMTATAYLRLLCQSGTIRKVMPNRAPRSHYFEWQGDSRT